MIKYALDMKEEGRIGDRNITGSRNFEMASENGKDKEDRVEELYAWFATIPFSKPKKNLTRDFSDAVFVADVLKAFYPRYVDLHNYIPASSVSTRKENWNTLNRKVLAKIDMKLTRETIHQLANAQSGVAERLLLELKKKILKDSEESADTLSAEKDSSDFEQGKNEENNLQSVSKDNSSATSPLNNELIIERPDSNASTFIRAQQKILFAVKWLINWIFVWNYLPDVSRFRLTKRFFETAQDNNVEVSTEQCGSEDLNKEDSVPRQMCTQLRQQLREKDDLISTLNHKVVYLESAMKLKDLRISNLTSQILHNAVETENLTKMQTSNVAQSKFRPRPRNPPEIKSN